MIIETKDWLSLSEAGKLKGLSKEKVNALLKQGKLQNITISKIVFVLRDDVKKFEAKPKKVKRKKD